MNVIYFAEKCLYIVSGYYIVDLMCKCGAEASCFKMIIGFFHSDCQNRLLTEM